MIGSSCHCGVRYWSLAGQIALPHFDIVWQLMLCRFIFFHSLSAAPTSEFRNDIPLARQACQVVSCAIVGCVINGDGQQLLPPFFLFWYNCWFEICHCICSGLWNTAAVLENTGKPQCRNVFLCDTALDLLRLSKAQCSFINVSHANVCCRD